jgi:hypothetical protein
VAHSIRKRTDTRKFAIYFPVGTPIGIRTANGIVYGTVGSEDGGNWIYPSFHNRGLQVLPGWCRASQVFIDERNATVPASLSGVPNAR